MTVVVEPTAQVSDRPVMVISGGSSGIGRATADVFAARGYRVYEFSRRGTDRDGVMHRTVDVTDAEAIRRAMADIWMDCGRLDVVISNAGFGIAGAIENTSATDIQRQFDVNFFGAVSFIQAAIPYFRASGGGRILCTSSVAAVTPIPFQSFYTCTKACINALVMTLNNELKPFGIHAVAVMPGDIRTGFTEGRVQNETTAVYGGAVERSIAKMAADEQSGGSPEPLARRFYRLATQKRIPKPLQGFGAVYRLLLVLAKLLPARLMNVVLYYLYAR